MSGEDTFTVEQPQCETQVFIAEIGKFLRKHCRQAPGVIKLRSGQHCNFFAFY